MKTRVALVGHGFLGKWHLEKILASSGAQLSAIVEVVESVRQQLAEKHPGIPIVATVEEAIPHIDAAIVVTPTSFHFEACKKLIVAGKHVFCEKPVTSTLEQARTLGKLLNGKKLVFQVGHSERFHRAWELLKSEVQAPFVESSKLIYLDRWAPFKGLATAVYVVQDLMIHDLDLVAHVFGERPTSISAKGLKFRTNNWDFVHAILEFKSGRQAHIRSGRGHVQEVRLLEMVGTHGILKVDLMSNQILSAEKNAASVEASSYEKRDHLLLEHQAFYQAIQKGTPVPVNIDDGISAVEMVDAVLRSVQSNTKVAL